MQRIGLETKIAAPRERCFLLSLSIDLHMESTAETGERAVAGVTRGVIGQGESVTWRGRHFGIVMQHTSMISGYERPLWFEDRMTEGMFQSFVHRHVFEEIVGGTLMRDELVFEAPMGWVGGVVERLALRPYLSRFLRERNEMIRRVAESDQEWVRYIGEDSETR